VRDAPLSRAPDSGRLSCAPTAQETVLVEAHVQYLAGLTRQGTVLPAGRTLNEDASTSGIVLLDVPSKDAARATMEQDPAVASGVFTADLFPYRVALVSPRLLELAPRRRAGRAQDDVSST